MAEYKPLTKEERETHAAFCERQLRLRTGNAGMAVLHDMAHLSLAYEATVKDRENRIAALEAELARLRPLAEVGEAVEGMPDAAEGGLSLETPHRLRPTWRLWGNHMGYRRTLVAEAETLSALFATIKADDGRQVWRTDASGITPDELIAALRAAKGEDDE